MFFIRTDSPSFEWVHTSVVPEDLGFSGGTDFFLFYSEPTQIRFFIRNNEFLKAIGRNAARWDVEPNVGKIREQATDYSTGMGVTIAHESGFHGIVKPLFQHLFSPKNGYVDAKSPPSSGKPIFSPDFGKKLIETLDLD